MRSHWYLKVASAADHVPGLQIALCASARVPVTAGGSTFAGGASGGGTSSATESALVVPVALTPVTWQATREPASLVVNV